MTFDSHSLDRLKELGRKLPKEISKSHQNESINPKEAKKQKLHPVEVETNPEQLFHELMDISQDGNVPPHLLERMRKLESNTLKTDMSKDKNTNMNKTSLESSIEDSQKLYTEFNQFLLEDEID